MNLPKNYEPKEYEDNIYALWEKSGSFKPKSRGSNETYSIVIPPPNANGNLHLGHGLTLGVEDIAIRYHRMKGDKTLFLPGADHAGFETQVVYEKKLNQEGKSRFDLNREELYQQIWDFVAQNKDNYESQFRRTGASLDWEHYTYTLDEKIVKTAYSSFKKMWDDKLIYRGERLVNFCTFHGTGFADIEVAYKDEIGKMYYVKFPLNPIDGVTDKTPYVLIATTRPETMLADVAVAVHPDDKRFAHIHGRTVTLPLSNREVPIIADTMVDAEFGTGAVKITAAHDPNDFEMAERHNLPKLRAITEEGKLGYDAPSVYHDLEVLEGRKKVVEDLDKLGLLQKVEDHAHRVGHCYKCGTAIQPLLREQWFIDMKPLTKPAIEALKAKKITFYPDSKRGQLINYLEGLRDWNISRQIAWGIPIPAFQNVDNSEDWIFDTRVDQEILEVDGKTYHRDPDVFDTWFSSSSWPYATLDYPDSEDFKDFYPLSVMETGADILYPWVSRMLMFGLYNTGQVPFESVYLHGLVLDEKGAKMSKSKGNVIDPMIMIDRYGSDAFRMGVIAGQTAGNNQSFDENRLVAARNFANKLWNVARFVEDKLGADLSKRQAVAAQTVADDWILDRLSEAVKTVSKQVETYRLAEAYDHVYHLLWDDFADWYVETSKVSLNPSVLAYGLETILKLTHPFAPFVTEAIWQTMKGDSTNLLMTSSWPTAVKSDKTGAADFEKLKGLVTEVRNLSATAGLAKPTLHFTANNLLQNQSELVKKLAKLGDITEVQTGQGLKLATQNFDAWLELDEKTRKKVSEQLANRLEVEQGSVSRLEARLANKSYVDNAPDKLVKETEAQLEKATNTVSDIKGQLSLFDKS